MWFKVEKCICVDIQLHIFCYAAYLIHVTSFLKQGHFSCKEKSFIKNFFKKFHAGSFYHGPYIKLWTGCAIFPLREVEKPQEQMEMKFHSAAPLSHLPEVRGLSGHHNPSPPHVCAHRLSKQNIAERQPSSAYEEQQEYLIRRSVQLACDRQLFPVTVCRVG